MGGEELGESRLIAHMLQISEEAQSTLLGKLVSRTHASGEEPPSDPDVGLGLAVSGQRLTILAVCAPLASPLAPPPGSSGENTNAVLNSSPPLATVIRGKRAGKTWEFVQVGCSSGL